jgi:hypothetical protein
MINTVCWNLEGSAEDVMASHLFCTGHQRLWHFKHGMILDVTELEGPGKVLYTATMGGTFYIRVSFEEVLRY